jgi:hypothetical protein
MSSWWHHDAIAATWLAANPEGRLMTYDVRLATRISTTVDRRLRMLALVQSQPLSHVLVTLLDRALPSADELAALLGADRHAEAAAPDEAAA